MFNDIAERLSILPSDSQFFQLKADALFLRYFNGEASTETIELAEIPERSFEEKATRIGTLIKTIRRTILTLEGEFDYTDDSDLEEELEKSKLSLSKRSGLFRYFGNLFELDGGDYDPDKCCPIQECKGTA